MRARKAYKGMAMEGAVARWYARSTAGGYGELPGLDQVAASSGVPVIHFGTGAAGFFRELHAAGGDVMGVDWRVNIDQAWMDISYRSAVQGNLDPGALFAPLSELKIKVTELLKRTGTRPGHIFNTGHGILPETPVESVKAVVQMVREFRP